jgi:putative salt-induced outer membrane protein YdiY
MIQYIEIEYPKISIQRTRENNHMISLKRNGFVLSLLMICVLLPAVRADQIVMKNGDRVTGSIIKKDGKNLTIKTDQLGVIVAPWDQVGSIVVEKPINIVLKDGKTLQGTFAATDGKVEVTTSQAKVNVALVDLSALRNADEQRAYERLLHPGWGELWTGNGTIGFAGTAGNSKTLTFTTGLNASRATNRDKTSLYFSAIKASSLVNGVNADSAKAVRGGIGYNHNVSPRLFLSAFNDYEYDRFQNLDLRFVIGGGLGLQALKSDRSKLDVVAGAAYNHSSYSTPLTQSSAELYWGEEYSLKLSSATTLTQNYRMFNNLKETGDYRINFDLGLSTKIARWLTWNASVSDRYLNNPAPGRKTNDFLYTTGIGITFAR